jgi:hypothetical protein
MHENYAKLYEELIVVQLTIINYEFIHKANKNKFTGFLNFSSNFKY